MFKNVIVYRTKNKFNKESLIEALQENQFTSCASIDNESSGWVSPREHGELVHVVDGRFLMKLITEKKVMPASVIKDAVLTKAKEIEYQQGFYPGRKQIKEVKERVIDELMPRAFAVKSSIYVWIDTINNLLFVDATTNSKAEQAIKPLLQYLEGIKLNYLRTMHTPRTMMTNWLGLDIEPDSFTIDQDGILESLGEGNAKIKYVKHSMDGDGVKQHIAGGKQCSALAMTWKDKISFVLTDTFQIKKISPLDVMMENIKTENKNDAERFDAEFLLMAGELSMLVIDLIDDLGGEYKQQEGEENE